jgi:prophage DNA circulation protein
MTVAPWRLQLVPASYNGASFYVEVQSRSGGFRLVVHEFPKKDIGWTESMGHRVAGFLFCRLALKL